VAAELFTLFGRIVTNANQAIVELGKVEGAATKTGASMSLGFAKANAAIQRNAGAIRAAGVAITAMGAGIAGAIAGMMRLAQQTGETAEQLRNQAAMTGLSRKQLQEYTFIAQQAGFSTEAITNASAFLQRNLMGIEEGTGNAADVMKSLGIAIHEADGSLRPMSALLPEVIGSLQGMGNETQRNMFAAQVFGRGWKEIAPLLAMTTAEMARQQQAARDLGIVWSDDMFAAADRADAAFDMLHAQMQGVAVSIASAVMPVITSAMPLLRDLMERVKELAAAAANWAKEHPGLAKGLLLAAGAVSGLMLALGPLIIALPGLIAAWPALSAAIAAVTGPIGLVIAALGTLVVAWEADWGHIREVVFNALLAIANQLMEFVNKPLRDFSTALYKLSGGRIQLAVPQWEVILPEGTPKSEWQAWLDKQKADLAELMQAGQKAVGGGGGGGGRGGAGGGKKGPTPLELSQAYGALLKAKLDFAAADKDDERRLRVLQDYAAWLTVAAEKWGALAQQSKEPAVWQWATELKTRLTDVNGELAKLTASMGGVTDEAQLRRAATFSEQIEELAPRVALAREELDRLRRLGYEGTVVWTDAMQTLNKLLDEQLRLQAQAGISQVKPGPYVAPMMDMLPPMPQTAEQVLAALRQRLAELQREWDTASLGRRETIVEERREIERQIDLLTSKWDDTGHTISGLWLHLAENIHDAFASSFEKLMSGASTLAGFFSDLFASIQRAFAQMIAKMVADWLFGVDQMQQTGQAGGLLGGLFNALVGMTGGGAAGAGGGEAGAGGGEAGAGGGEVQGGWGDPGFAHAAAGMVIRRPTVLLAGERGTEIIRPFHTGPELAMAGAGGNTTMQVTIYANDAASFVDMLQRNRSGLAAAIQTAVRENAPVGRR
jgi:TP901 family phage tail tape measure protein